MISVLAVDICKSGSEMAMVFGLVKFILRVICIVVPVVMILLGTIDLFKAVTAGKDEEIKKRQKALITRLIAGIIVFLVPSIVSLLMGLIGQSSKSDDSWKACWDNASTSWKNLFKVD